MTIIDTRLDALMLEATPHQLHLSPTSDRLTRGRFISPLERMQITRYHERKVAKPLSHLWTCDVMTDDVGGVTSAWVQLMRDSATAIARRDPARSWWHYLVPRVDARVLRIATLDEYRYVQQIAGVGDFDAIPTRWLFDRVDAIRIEQPAVDRLSRYAIDYGCASTGWFRWCFESSRVVTTPDDQVTT